MQRVYPEREAGGPEFDNKLIKLVKANPAIYDVSHPHYRRNPVRVAIWERIAAQMGAPSRFLQTKWKNIRYNYLQEIKCLETGINNPNIRKRRFTEDLSFLQHTAQSYNVKKAQLYRNNLIKGEGGSDNDSNSFIYPDADYTRPEVIEIANSDEEASPNYKQQNGTGNGTGNGDGTGNGGVGYEGAGMMDYYHEQNEHEMDDYDEFIDDDTYPSFNVETELKEYDDEDVELNLNEKPIKPKKLSIKKEKDNDKEKDKDKDKEKDNDKEKDKDKDTNQDKDSLDQMTKKDSERSLDFDKDSSASPKPSNHSNSSSPMLAPLVIMANGEESKNINGEITIERVTTSKTNYPTTNGNKKSSASNRNQQNHLNHYNQMNLSNQQPQLPSKKRVAASEIMTNIAKRKAMPAPFPCLTPINDPIELYCLSLVDSLRNMPRSERERVKFEFANILKDAKYKDQT